jgi:hypothetical protein
VLQPLVNPVVDSNQSLCQKISFFWQFSAFRSFLLEFRHNYRAFTVLVLITHAYGEDSSVYFNSETFSANFDFGLGSSSSPANKAFSQVSITNNHKVFNLIVQPQPMELWTSLQMAKLASSQLVTPAAYYYNLTIENDSLVENRPQQSSSIFTFTWKWCQLSGFTFQLAFIKFPIFSMVNKPNQIILDYIGNENIYNTSSNLLYLIWSTTRGERAFQILFDVIYLPIGPTV